MTVSPQYCGNFLGRTGSREELTATPRRLPRGPIPNRACRILVT